MHKVIVAPFARLALEYIDAHGGNRQEWSCIIGSEAFGIQRLYGKNLVEGRDTVVIIPMGAMPDSVRAQLVPRGWHPGWQNP